MSQLGVLPKSGVAESVDKVVEKYMENLKRRLWKYDIKYGVSVRGGLTVLIIRIRRELSKHEVLWKCRELTGECAAREVALFNRVHSLAPVYIETDLYEIESLTNECDPGDLGKRGSCYAGGTVYLVVKSTNPSDVARALSALDSVISRIVAEY